MTLSTARIRLATAAAFVAVSSVAAVAADLPVRSTYTKAPALDPVANWSGFYIGGQVGGASMSTTTRAA
jgi:outer membrane immunogenic protein